MLLETVSYIPALLYLLVLGLWKHSPPAAWYIPIIPMMGFNFWQNGLITMLISTGAALVLFAILLVFPLGGKTVYSIIVPAISVPLGGWVMLIPGILFAAIASYWIVHREKGGDYVKYLTNETIVALGASSNSANSSFMGLGIPSPKTLPIPKESEQGKRTIPLVWLMFVSVGLTAIVSLFV